MSAMLKEAFYSFLSSERKEACGGVFHVKACGGVSHVKACGGVSHVKEAFSVSYPVR